MLDLNSKFSQVLYKNVLGTSNSPLKLSEKSNSPKHLESSDFLKSVEKRLNRELYSKSSLSKLNTNVRSKPLFT